MGFPRQEYWSGLLFPTPGDVQDPGIEPTSPALAGRFLTTVHLGSPGGLFWVLANKKSADLKPSVRAGKTTNTLMRLESP